MNILAYQDTYFRTAKDEITYVVRLGETETAVFYGRAVKSPDEPYIYIKINDIAQQYLDVDIPDFRDFSNNVTLHSNGILQFKLYEVTAYTATTENGDTTIVSHENYLQTYNVLCNYNYEDEWDGGMKRLSNPVNGHLDSRMKLFWTAVADGNTYAPITTACHTSGEVPTTGSTPSVDSGDTIYTGETGTFAVTGGDGAVFNNGANVWYVAYDTDYPSVYYVFSGATGFSTGYTSGGQVSFYIPATTASSTSYTVYFYPYDGGAVLDDATATQDENVSYSFAFNNPDGQALSSSSTSNSVTWTTTYPSITYYFYRWDTLLASGNTLNSGVTVFFGENTDTENAATYSFQAYYNGVLLDTLTWTQDAAEEPEPELPFDQQYFTVEFGDSPSMFKVGKLAYSGLTYYYSVDRGNIWHVQDLGEELVFANSTGLTYADVVASKKVLFKGENGSYMHFFDYLEDTYQGSFKVYGNIMSLLYGDEFYGETTLPDPFSHRLDTTIYPYDLMGAFQNMFDGFRTLTSAENLILPPTTKGYCYANMFSGCWHLTEAPELPASAMSPCCYQEMFKDCVSMSAAPELPATTLAEECYAWMFAQCWALRSGPDLPAPFLTTACYSYMFAGCSVLSSLRCMAYDVSATGCTVYWLNAVSATGTFTKAGSTTYTSGPSGIPSGWTVIDIA